MNLIIIIATLIAGFTGFFAIVFAMRLIRQEPKKKIGTPKMIEIADAIRIGARTYLSRQFLMVAIFGATLTIALGYVLGILAALTFSVGAVLSALSAYIGVTIAINANVRTAAAGRKGIDQALRTATRNGTIIGMSLTGLALLGVSMLYMIFQDPSYLLGLGFGASLICLFARVGGGIYTKGADMGADLVGKVEVGIPEDDPRNPAVIADQVGDNVGDIAGTGSDVFQSYVMALVAAMVLGFHTFNGHPEGLAYPLAVAAAGILSSLVASFFIRFTDTNPQRAIYRGMYVGIILVCALSAFAGYVLFGGLNEFYSTLVGIAAIVILAWITLYYTSPSWKPVREIAEASKTGPAINIIFGFARGFESTVAPVVVSALAVFLAWSFSGLYGISMLAVGFLSMAATLTAMSSYGPIVDNAKGIVEFAGVGDQVVSVMNTLDSVGNSTKAVCKVYAIQTSAFAQVAIFSAFVAATGLNVIDVTRAPVTTGLIIGGMLSFLIASQILKACGKSAYRMIEEVRRQFAEIPGLKEGKAKPDYKKCVDISTRGALRGMFFPAALTIIVPLAVGYIFGIEAVGGLLAGNLVTTLPLALMMVQGGASWDNAKKYVEEGNLGGIGSPAHAAAVVGDTVGDPFKDAAGASLDVLMNLIGTISILFASSFMAYALFA
ncbi:MAG TPA: sodium-translocating pyrophosphatase [Candidatus Krumholzibacteriaceae bacterium]|nr:sodium-translocating pyrophosphatase [Candidatus Krumholzibacteriaceae bacterium]